jgi:hypothetical protein
VLIVNTGLWLACNLIFDQGKYEEMEVHEGGMSLERLLCILLLKMDVIFMLIVK